MRETVDGATLCLETNDIEACMTNENNAKRRKCRYTSIKEDIHKLLYYNMLATT